MINVYGRYPLLGLKSAEEKVMGPLISLSFFFFLPLISLEVSLHAGPGPSPH